MHVTKTQVTRQTRHHTISNRSILEPLLHEWVFRSCLAHLAVASRRGQERQLIQFVICGSCISCNVRFGRWGIGHAISVMVARLVNHGFILLHYLSQKGPF